MPQKNASLESCRVVKGSGDAFAGLTQEQAAERILVSRQTVSNWETGVSQS